MAKPVSSKDIDLCKNDVWSLGVTYYAMTFLKLPFYGQGPIEVVEQAINNQ